MFAYDFDREDATIAEESGGDIRDWEVPGSKFRGDPPQPYPAHMRDYDPTPPLDNGGEPIQHFNSTILSHAYYEYVKRIGHTKAGRVLHNVPATLSPDPPSKKSHEASSRAPERSTPKTAPTPALAPTPARPPSRPSAWSASTSATTAANSQADAAELTRCSWTRRAGVRAARPCRSSRPGGDWHCRWCGEIIERLMGGRPRDDVYGRERDRSAAVGERPAAWFGL